MNLLQDLPCRQGLGDVGCVHVSSIVARNTPTNPIAYETVLVPELYSHLASCAMPTGDEGTDLDMGDLGSLGEVVADLGADLAAAPGQCVHMVTWQMFRTPGKE